jgi:tripartite-type tricarboxylate transporter receptor subunit TctC
VARSAADGYTLLVNTGSLWTAPFFGKIPYDPVKDFAPISLVSRSPNVLVVHPSLPVKNVKELIALAKAHPGELNFSHGSIGASSHLSAELFKSMAGVDIVRVHYKSAGSEIADLLGGHVQMSFGSTGSVLALVKAGRLRGLAVTTPERTELVPGLPTVAESGLPGYESGQIVGFFAPAKTPEAIVRRLSQETMHFLTSPATSAAFFEAGADSVGSSPGELATTIKSEMARLGKIIQSAGIKAD